MSILNNTEYDALVVGGGIAGIIAALYIQQAGYKVGIIEKRDRLGGLSGLQHINGYDFVLATNEYGQGLLQMLKELNLDIPFLPVKNYIYFEEHKVQLPPNLSTGFSLLSHGLEFWKLIQQAKKRGDNSLFDIMSENKFSDRFRDYVNLLYYGLGIPPKHLSIKTLKAAFSKTLGYGYDKSVIPKGSPAQMIKHMEDAFKQRGGDVLLNTDYIEHTAKEAGKQVKTSQGMLTCTNLVSSAGRWDQYPDDSCKTGLAMSMICIALQPGFAYPKGIHSISYFSKDIEKWVGQLDNGEQLERFGFHFFKCDVPTEGKYQAINVYFFSPRGEYDPTEERKANMEAFILDKIEELLPDFKASILFKKYLSPKEFEERNNIKSIPVPKVSLPEFDKPDIYDAERDIYYIGNSVQPEGDHAGGAALSGKMASELVIKALKQTMQLS